MTKLQQALKKKLFMEAQILTVVLITGLYWPFQYMLYVLFLTLSSDSFLLFLKTMPKEQLFSICSWALQQTTVSLLATLSSLL